MWVGHDFLLSRLQLRIYQLQMPANKIDYTHTYILDVLKASMYEMYYFFTAASLHKSAD